VANFLEEQGYEQRRALVRDISERQAQVRDDPGFIDTVAKFAAIASAGYLIGRKAVRSDSVIDALHHLGQFGRRVTAPVSGVVRGMMDEFAGVVRGPAANVRNFDLLEHVSESLALVGQLRASGHTASSIQGIVQATRMGLRDRGFEDLDRAGLSRFRAATVDDILRQPGLQTAIGQRGFETIRTAHEMGMLSSQTALTRGNLGLLINPRAPGQFVDTRWASPRAIMGGAANLLRQVQVPFLGLRPGDMLLALLRPFGEGHFAGQVGRKLEVAPNTRTGATANAVVGGRLLSYRMGGWTILSDNVRINPIGRVGQAHLERYGNAEGFVGKDLANRVHQNRGGFKGLVDLVKYATGVGPDYRTRDPVAKTALWDPLIRREKGEVVKHEYVRRRDSQGFFDNLRDYVHAEERGVNPNRYLNEAVKNEGELSWWDRLSAHWRMSRRASVVAPGAKPNLHAPSSPIDFVTTSPEYIGQLAGRRPAVPGVDFVPPGPAGTLRTPPSVPMDFYAYAGKGRGWDHDLGTWVKGQADALLDVGHYMTNRLNDLFGMTIGVGFRPSVGAGLGAGSVALGKNLAKIYGIYHGFQAGLEYLNYADYVAEMALKPVLTGFGAFDHDYTSPKKIAIGAYQAARIGQTALRELTGVSAAANYLEDLMPGSMSTALSDLARTAGPALYGAAKGGIGGLKGGLAVAALIGGNEPGKSLTEVVEEFKGEKLVPVRKSRWWVMGRQPWEGGQIDHFAPHWTVRALSDYKYTDVRYGSKDEYFTNVSRVPTPHNLFGLIPIFQEGGYFGGGDLHLAKKHQYDRPYPDTPGVDQAEAMMQATYMAARGPYDPPMASGQRLGYGTAGTMPEPPGSKAGMLGTISALSSELSELTGMYKFLLWDLPGFGQGSPPKLASYSEMNSQAHDFWDANLGGLLGMTELYRRFNTPEEARAGINPIPNVMPPWLPGARSENPDDRNFNVDFTLGDPYAKIQGGEYRLPGAGYEELHRLHSGSPGVYDAMDRFLILADVAPNSRAFAEYRTIVESWEKAGVLDAHWSEKFKTTKKQVRDKMERYHFFDRRFTGTITDDTALREGRYNLVEKAVAGVYEVLAHDVFPKVTEPIPVLGSILSDKLFPVHSPIEHYERFQIYGEEFADWRSPWRQLVRPKLHQLTAQDPLTASAGGAALAMFGANPVAAFALGAAGMIGLGGASSVRAMSTGRIEGGYVPDFRQREFELQEYFDNLQYVKSTMLKERADAVGDQEISDFYTTQMARTVSGLSFGQKDQHTFIMQAMRALPRNQRAYLLPFMRMPEQAQTEMTSYLPPSLAPVFLRASGRQFEPIFDDYRALLKTSPHERVAAFFRENGGVPDAEWGGWHPDVPMDAIKIKMVDAGAGSTSSDIHKFDLFNEHRYRASKFESLDVPMSRRFGHVMPSGAVGANLYSELEAAGFENVRLRHVAGRQDGDDVHWSVRRMFQDLGGAIDRILR
jgi:hypothetical protein